LLLAEEETSIYTPLNAKTRANTSVLVILSFKNIKPIIEVKIGDRLITRETMNIGKYLIAVYIK